MRRLVARGTLAVLGGLIGASLGLSGCATMSGGVPGDIRRALEQSDSAIGTGSLALSLHQGGDASSAVAATALEDSLDELIDAATQLTRLTVSTENDATVRTDALNAVRDAEDAMQDARSSVLGASNADARTELEQARAGVETQLERLP